MLYFVFLRWFWLGLLFWANLLKNKPQKRSQVFPKVVRQFCILTTLICTDAKKQSHHGDRRKIMHWHYCHGQSGQQRQRNWVTNYLIFYKIPWWSFHLNASLGGIKWKGLFRNGLPRGKWGEGVLPYIGYIGTCRGIGYGFWGSRSLNRVSFLTL